MGNKSTPESQSAASAGLYLEGTVWYQTVTHCELVGTIENSTEGQDTDDDRSTYHQHSITRHTQTATYIGAGKLPEVTPNKVPAKFLLT